MVWEEATGKQKSGEVLWEASRTVELGVVVCCVWVKRLEHSSASSLFYWTLSTGAVKNKGNNQSY